MSIFDTKSTISITCPKRMTSYLKEELNAINFPVIKQRKAGVETKGTLRDTMKLNLLLRSAHRVHYLVDEFNATQSEHLYKQVNKIPWEKYIDETGYVSVTSVVHTPAIKNTQYANLTCKDAIVDRIRKIKGIRPNSGPDLSHTVVFLYWRGKKCRIFLDTSGESLSRRGYRTESHTAPLQETLAHALVHATGWIPDQHFINPMCGSGTLAIESALKGLHRAAGSLRPNFGIKHIKGFDEEEWSELRNELKKQADKDIPGKIIATDVDRNAIRAARKNAKTAGVDHLIDFRVCDFRNTPLPEGNGVVIMNPPYGERLGNADQLKKLYRSIGDFFKQECTNYTGYVFTGNLELAKHIGLRTSRRMKFYNSTIDCRLLKFELYKGSRD